MFNINSAKKAIISHYRENSDLGLRFPCNDRTDEVSKWYVFFKYGIMSRKTDIYFVVIKVSCLCALVCITKREFKMSRRQECQKHDRFKVARWLSNRFVGP